MLHTLLELTRPLVLFDTETTGTNPETDRIIELGFQQWGPDGLVKEWRSLINPGIPIPESASAVHGLTDAHMRVCRRCRGDVHPTETCEEFMPIYTFQQMAQSLARGFTGCDFAGKNIRFDLRILQAEMTRAHVPWGYADARVIDADRLEQLGEPRTLSHLYEKHLGRPLENAHGALVDVKASVEVIAAQLQKYDVLPRTLDALHELQWPGWIDTDGKFRFVDGTPTVMFGKHRNEPFGKVPRDYWKWLADKSDFSDEVKDIARRVMIGKPPQPGVRS